MDTPIEIKKRALKEWVDVYEFHGELDETNADKVFTGIYSTIWEFSGKKVVFNFKALTYLNSKSIGYIADIYSNLDENDGVMFICECSEEVYDTLELVGITSIVTTLDSEKEVLEELEK